MVLLLPMRGRGNGPDQDLGLGEGLKADAAFRLERHLLAAFENAIAAHTIGNPDQAGQTGDFKSPAFQCQDLVVGHSNTLRAERLGSPEHDHRSFRMGSLFPKGKIDQESRIR
jgi:hypothetical protein